MSKYSRRRAALGYEPAGDPLNDLPARYAKEQESQIMQDSCTILGMLVQERFPMSQDLARSLVTIAGAILMLNQNSGHSLVATAYNCKQYSEALFELLQTKRTEKPSEPQPTVHD